MSVYNRKMFKPRNARNALNRSAGIPNVQKFANGGTVAGYRSFTGMPGQSPIGRPGNPISKFLGIPQAARQYSQNPASMTRAQQADVLAGQDRFNVYNALPKIPGNTRIGNVLSEAYRQTGANLAGMGSGIARLLGDETAPLLQYALGSPDGPGTDTFGGRVSSLQRTNPELSQDYLRSLGITEPLDPTNLQSPTALGRPAPPAKIPEGGMAADRIKDDASKIPDGELAAFNRARDQARAGTQSDGEVYFDEQTGTYKSGTAPEIQALKDEYQENVDQTDRDDATVDLAGTGASTDGIDDDGTGTDGAGDGTDGAGDGTDGAGDGTLTAKEEIDRVINSGSPEEQQDQLKTLMAEFTENAPEYKGIDKGLAMAKIGFAMAAGKSSNAIQNIASALEDGADMLIKDQGKKDEFNRQVKLSALQYGLKDISAERQLKRAAEFQTSDYVLMPGQKYTYPDGRSVTGSEGGTTISLRKSDILENGLPDGVQGTAMATALITKKAAFEAAIAKAKADGIKSRTLDTPKKITEYVENYDNSVTDVIKSNNAMHLTKQVMIANAEGKITGFQPGFNSMLAKAMTLANVDAKEYTDRDLAIADLRKVFQKLVPLTLGKDQSANSISDKDVNRLADAYMSDAILSGGVLGLMTTPPNVLDSKLGGILVEFENAQKSALDKLNSLEETGAEFLTPSGSALGTRVSAQRKRLQPFLPQGSRSMLSIGDDGIYRLG